VTERRFGETSVSEAAREKRQNSVRWLKRVLKRLESIVEALPAAAKQTHDPIFGEWQVANDEKLLSLFEL